MSARRLCGGARATADAAQAADAARAADAAAGAGAGSSAYIGPLQSTVRATQTRTRRGRRRTVASTAEIATGTLLVHVLKKEDEQLNRKGAGAKQVSNAADTLNKTRGS